MKQAGYFFNTANDQYSVTYMQGAGVGVLNGGKFHDCYIHLPQMAGEGQPFIAQFVNDARNPESLRGKTLRTSPIHENAGAGTGIIGKKEKI